MSFKINNRRYTGSKAKLALWIKDIIIKECQNSDSFFDLFAGTGIITSSLLDYFSIFYINDFLYSNQVIYNAFFGSSKYNDLKIYKVCKDYNNLPINSQYNDFVTKNYGGKYFSFEDSQKIDYIRNDILKRKKSLLKREHDILLASLLYSLDRSANTVGHYDAYFKTSKIRNKFTFELIKPLVNKENKKKVFIFREDANLISSKIKADVVYIDPPYSSRQYSRFYHVLETITKWDKPNLTGRALKPPAENTSEYSKSKALDYFRQLIYGLKSKFIVVSYNNTYSSKSKSSKNKMTLEEIKNVLNERGITKIFKTKHSAFNSGKTDFEDHMEMLFVTKVGK